MQSPTCTHSRVQQLWGGCPALRALPSPTTLCMALLVIPTCPMCCACHSLCRHFMEPLCLNHTTYFTHAGSATSVSVRPPWRADAAGQSGAQDVLGSEPDAHRWLGATAPSACRTTLQRRAKDPTRTALQAEGHTGTLRTLLTSPKAVIQRKNPAAAGSWRKPVWGSSVAGSWHGSCPGPICFAWFWFLQSYDSGFRVSP